MTGNGTSAADKPDIMKALIGYVASYSNDLRLPGQNSDGLAGIVKPMGVGSELPLASVIMAAQLLINEGYRLENPDYVRRGEEFLKGARQLLEARYSPKSPRPLSSAYHPSP